MDFDLIYKQYFRDVFLYLRSLSANEDIAEEIAQETFAKALKAIVALTAVIATILALCIGYGIFDHFAYREEIAVNGAVYARSRETVSEIPEGSVELGYLRSILHRNIGSPSVDFSGTNLDEKYGGCGLYQDPENEMVIYLEDYGGFYIPFVLKEYIVQPETP